MGGVTLRLDGRSSLGVGLLLWEGSCLWLRTGEPSSVRAPVAYLKLILFSVRGARYDNIIAEIILIFVVCSASAQP